MYLTGKIDLKAYTDSTQTAFPKELIPSIEKEFSDEAVTSVQVLNASIPANTTQAINMNTVTPTSKVYVYSDLSDVTLAMNGGGAILYKKGSPGIMPLELTSLTVANVSQTIATNVTIILIAG